MSSSYYLFLVINLKIGESMRAKQNWLKQNIVGFGLTSFFNDFSHEMTTAILPAFIKELVGPTNTALFIGIISSVSDAISSFAKIWSGLITDKVQNWGTPHNKFFLIIGYALTPIFVSLIGLSKYIWQVLIYKTVAWFGRGLREPMRDTWIANIEKPENYGKAFGFVRIADTMGAVAGPLIAFFLLKIYTLKTIFFISLIPGVFSVLSLIFLTHEEKINNKIYKHITLLNQLKNLPQNFNYFIFVMFLFGIGNFNKLLIIYRAQELLTGQATSSIVATGWAILLYTLFNIIRGISEFGIGALSDWEATRNLNRKGARAADLLAIFGFAFFGLVNIALLIPSNNIFLWVFIFVFAGISTGAVTTLEKAYAAELLPDNVRGTGFGVLQMTDGSGDLISSLVVGLFWTYLSPEFSFFYAAILSFLSAILLYKR